MNEAEKINKVLSEALICHLAFSNDDEPYVLAFNYGYEDGVIYVHTGVTGKKLEMLERNPRVCFAVENQVSVISKEKACQFSMRFASVVGYGQAEVIANDREKAHALDVVVRHYGGNPIDYAQEVIDRTRAIKIKVDSMSYREKRLEE